MPKKKFSLKEQPFIAKLGITLVLDVLDFTIFRIPIIGTVYDLAVTGIMYDMVGMEGLLAGWEVIEPTDQIDAEVPSATGVLLINTLTNKR
jgi:hypothetical protein